MKSAFFKEIGSSIGYIWGLIGTLATILTVSGSTEIDIRWIILICAVIISLIVISVISVRKCKQVLNNGTRFNVIAYDRGESGEDLYYTDYTNSLRYNSLVTVYYTKDFSKKLCYGIVCNTVPDEYVEIKVLHVEAGFDSVFEQSKNNNVKVFRNMYILPNVYVEELDVINSIINKGGKKNDKKEISNIR